MKIWLRLHKGEKTLRHTTVEIGETTTVDDFTRIVRAGCHEMDAPTPMILTSHVLHFAKFGVVRFYPDDYIEEIGFDKMEMEILKKKG